MRIELRIEGTPRRAARNLEDRLEVVRVRLLGLWIGPRTLPRELAILRPDAVRQRHRANLVAGNGRVDRHDVAGDLLLHDRVAELVEHGVPHRVVAELETLIGEPFHFLETPLLL